MAENFEAYHVPQQSRRDKLRVVIPNHPGCVENLQGCSGLLPLYDPSLISSDLLTCASFHHPLGDNSKSNQNQGCGGGVKEEGMNLMRYVGGIINASSSSSTSQHMFMDPHSSMSMSMSMHINPTSIQDVNNHPFIYNHSFNGNEVVVYKPEPLSMAHEPNTTGGQGLSLSLSSHHNHNHNHQTNLPLELNLQRYESSVYADKVTLTGGYLGSTSNDLSRSTVPLGPFTGYASILKGSRFLKPAQQLLEELCNVGCGIYAEKITADSTLLDPPSESLSRSGIVDDPSSCGDGSESRRKKSRLISMLDEVYRRYKQYYQQMQAVVASFETVAGLSNAAPFANLALKAMSKHFRCLKKAITDQLQFTTKFHSGHMSCVNDETPRSGNDRGSLYGQRPINNLGFMDHQPVWRPQRGLPERAVTVLRAWLFEHFLHPYPTDTDKLMLAKQTGLSRNQVSNWFINARVRLWKPMVEEIHSLETRQAQKPSERHDQNANRMNDHLAASENPSTSTHRVQDLPSKRTRNDFPNNSMGSEEPMNLLYDNSSRHSQGGVGVSSINGPGGVSLTLGLHQNNGIGLSDPFPMNAARRFGLDANSDGFVMGAFEAQNRQFGRDMMGGGQLLHDFVG